MAKIQRKAFRKGIPDYQAFPYWDHLALELGGDLYPLASIAWSDLIFARTQQLAEFGMLMRGFPIYIARSDDGSTVGIYPVPDDDVTAIVM